MEPPLNDLRFVCSSPERSLSVTEPPTEKWGLVDVAHNNTRGSSQRLREKREKIRQATHRPSSANGAQSLVSDVSLCFMGFCDLYVLVPVTIVFTL